MNGDRLVFVDGLRGLAAVLVMLFHYEGRLDFPLTFGYGHLGVPIFFVLSGFVITMTITGKDLSFGFLGRFALRRAIRLDVPYWASIALIIFIATFGAKFGAQAKVPTLPQLGAHLIYAQDLLGYGGLSPVFWSLCYEVQFYLFLVLLMMGIGKVGLKQTGMLLVFCGLIVLSLLERGPLEMTAKGVAFVFWFNFAIGGLTYWVISGRVRQEWLFAMLGAVLIHAIVMKDPFAYTAVATCVALYLAGRFGYMQTWLSDRVFQFLGRTSYSIYIFHNIIGWYALSIAVKFVDGWIALIVGITAALVSAWLSYTFIEKPSINLSRRVSLVPARPPDLVPQVG